jgi:hypothetical protein
MELCTPLLWTNYFTFMFSKPVISVELCEIYFYELM